MGRAEIRTRIADLIEDNLTTLKTVVAFVPESVADSELPCAFVGGTVEVATYPNSQDNVRRDQTWLITILYQEVGLGWPKDHQDKLDDLIDAAADLFVGKRGLRRNGVGLDMVNATQYTGCRVTTPFAFPANQSRKYYHAVELTVVVQTEQLCS